jgi:hypothetical protein
VRNGVEEEVRYEGRARRAVKKSKKVRNRSAASHAMCEKTNGTEQAGEGGSDQCSRRVGEQQRRADVQRRFNSPQLARDGPPSRYALVGPNADGGGHEG